MNITMSVVTKLKIHHSERCDVEHGTTRVLREISNKRSDYCEQKVVNELKFDVQLSDSCRVRYRCKCAVYIKAIDIPSQPYWLRLG